MIDRNYRIKNIIWSESTWNYFQAEHWNMKKQIFQTYWLSLKKEEEGFVVTCLELRMQWNRLYINVSSLSMKFIHYCNNISLSVQSKAFQCQ